MGAATQHGTKDFSFKLNLEGIVSKRIDLPYESSPSMSWQKTKNKESTRP